MMSDDGLHARCRIIDEHVCVDKRHARARFHGQSTAVRLPEGLAGRCVVVRDGHRVLWRASRLGHERMPSAVFTVAATSLVLLTVTRSLWAVILFAVVFGMCNGMAPLLRAALIGDLYGRRRYGAI